MPLRLQRSITPGRCIVFLICLSLTVMLSVSSSNPEVEPLPHHDVQFVPRQDLSQILPSSPTSTPTSTSTTTSETPSHTNTVTSTSSTPSPTSTPQSPTSTPPPQTNSPTPPPAQVSSVESTGSDGSKTVIIVTVSASGSSTSTPTPSSPPKGDENSGLGTGSIIGLSVAGGIALLGIIAFFIWKFTRKRRSANYDDGEIKWPDLNSESHVAGQDHAGVQNSTDGGSLRDPSFRGAYGEGGLGASQSQVDLYAADPYAVPPLPHLNPNQPYRDDPGAAPYHDGFNPPGFHESRPSSPSIRGEVIPMNQINRTKSPGPQAALPPAYGAGRQSPGPQEAYGAGYGRQSPGPQDAYGGGYGRRSPGPNDAYGPR